MNNLKTLFFCVFSLSLLSNAVAFDLQDTKLELQQFVNAVVPEENDLVADVALEFGELLDEVCVELEKPQNTKIKDEFIAACKPIFDVKDYKDYHKRELKDSLEKFNNHLMQLSDESFLDNVLNVNGKLVQELPDQSELVTKIQRLDASLYTILLEGKKLNDKKLDDILDFFYHRPAHFVKEHKKETIIVAGVSLAVLIAVYYLYNKNKADITPQDTSREQKSIEELDLSKKATDSLKASGITTVGDLLSKDKNALLKIRGIGRATISKIEDGLERLWKKEKPDLASKFEKIDSVVQGRNVGGHNLRPR